MPNKENLKYFCSKSLETRKKYGSLKSLKNLPDSIEKLDLTEIYDLGTINYLPESLITLITKKDTETKSIRKINYLPNNIKRIELFKTTIQRVPKLPNSLKVLTIYNSLFSQQYFQGDSVD